VSTYTPSSGWPYLSAKIFCAEAVQAKLGTLSLEAQSKLEKETAKKEAKADAKADAALKKKLVRVSIFYYSLPRSPRAGIASWSSPNLGLRETLSQPHECLGDYLPY
jgi:hypothetical protein